MKIRGWVEQRPKSVLQWGNAGRVHVSLHWSTCWPCPGSRKSRKKEDKGQDDPEGPWWEHQSHGLEWTASAGGKQEIPGKPWVPRGGTADAVGTWERLLQKTFGRHRKKGQTSDFISSAIHRTVYFRFWEGGRKFANFVKRDYFQLLVFTKTNG